MVTALFRARSGSGASKPSSKRIMKSTQRFRSALMASTTGPICSSVMPKPRNTSATSSRSFCGSSDRKLETHHEIHPAVPIGADGIHYGADMFLGHAEAAKYIGHLVALFLREFDGLAKFAGALAFVVVAVRARGQIPAEAHGDGPGGDFGESGDDHQLAGGGHRPGEPGSQREGNREAIGHSDDDIADGVRGFEVRFDVHLH